MKEQKTQTDDNDMLVLTPEQEKMVRDALEAKKAGERSLTADEVREYCEKHLKTWHPGRSA